MKLLSILFLTLGLIACSKEEPKLSSDVQNCISNDQNPMLVLLREKAPTDLGAKVALQQTCEELVRELKKGK
jgi:hypothetical protein